MNPILFGDEKAKGSLFLPAEWVGLQKHPPLALLAKDRKAQGSLLPIRVGRGLGDTFLNPILFGNEKAEGLSPLPSGKVGAYRIRPLILPAKNGKAQGLTPLPSGKVGAYCIRPLALPAKGVKAKGSLFLPSSKVGVYCIRPLALLAKDGKAKGSLFPIRVG